mmetsp:Transcript_10815/g.10436  ORF Transcript_10815/g.10436 Transcript_10815/m.10436 type:complete len:106 (+) Transcript_10815:1226-1543(+)
MNISSSSQLDLLMASLQRLRSTVMMLAVEISLACTVFFFTAGPVNCFEDAAKSDMSKFAKWHREMLKRGIYLAPSQYEAGFTSLAHTVEDVDKTIEIAREVMALL